MLLDLPGLPRLSDAFAEGPVLWVVRDYVDGTSLEELRALQGGRFSRESILDLTVRMARVLEDLHRAQMLAVDVKPANFVRTIDGRIVLIDAGSATPIGNRLAMATGTHGFVAPEVATGAPLTAAADIFGLAETITWLLSGATVSPDPTRELGSLTGTLGPVAVNAMQQALGADPSGRPTLQGLVDAFRAPQGESCPQCGKQVASGRAFCGGCGSAIARDSINVQGPAVVPTGPRLLLQTEYRRPRTLAAAIERRGGDGSGTPPELARLWHLVERLALTDGFESLVAVDRANIDSYDHQRTAALRILREFRDPGSSPMKLASARRSRPGLSSTSCWREISLPACSSWHLLTSRVNGALSWRPSSTTHPSSCAAARETGARPSWSRRTCKRYISGSLGTADIGATLGGPTSGTHIVHLYLPMQRDRDRRATNGVPSARHLASDDSVRMCLSTTS